MSKKQIILIIDDDTRIARMLERRINRMDVQTFIVNNGHEGVAKTFELMPDLILLDIRMPGKDGYSVIKTLRERGYKGLVVACSASINAKDSQLPLQAGCDYFMGKPLEDTFEEQIQNMLKSTL